MKRTLATALFVLIISVCGVAFASLDDTRATIQSQYGEFRMVIDTDDQTWAKTEWDERGHLRAKAAAYTYSFTRQDLGTQLEVAYTGDGPKATIYAQRFTPNMAIKIKDFKNYYPEVYKLIIADKAQAFASYSPVTRQFQEQQSPVTMGVIIKAEPATQKNFYTLLVFNISDEGRLVKDIKYIDENTYVREFTIERVFPITATDALSSFEWKPIKNYF